MEEDGIIGEKTLRKTEKVWNRVVGQQVYNYQKKRPSFRGVFIFYEFLSDSIAIIA